MSHTKIKEVDISDFFRVKVVYNKEPESLYGLEKVSIQNSGNGTPIEVEAKNSTDDPLVFLTDLVWVEPR